MKDFRGYDADAYYKDINDELNTFEGTWSGDDGNYALTIQLVKVKGITGPNGAKEDLLHGSLHAELTDPTIPHPVNVVPSYSITVDNAITDNMLLSEDQPELYVTGLSSQVPNSFQTYLSGQNVTWSNLTTEASFRRGEVIMDGDNVASRVFIRMSHYMENSTEKILAYVSYVGIYTDWDSWFMPPGFYVLTKQP